MDGEGLKFIARMDKNYCMATVKITLQQKKMAVMLSR